MAENNSIDLTLGSQDLSSDFYQYHRRFGGIWYIKNSRGQFLDCSDEFLIKFCPDYITERDVFLQKQPNSLFGFFSLKVREYEISVQSIQQVKFLLISLTSNDGQLPYIFTLKPYSNGVYAQIDTLFFLGSERKIIKSLYSRECEEINTSLQHHRFVNINPFLELGDPDNWLVAWLMACRVSQRNIAKFMDVNTKTIERRASAIYTSLVVGNYDNFMILSDLYQWSKYIPPRFYTSPVLSEVFLM